MHEKLKKSPASECKRLIKYYTIKIPNMAPTAMYTIACFLNFSIAKKKSNPSNMLNTVARYAVDAPVIRSSIPNAIMATEIPAAPMIPAATGRMP